MTIFDNCYEVLSILGQLSATKTGVKYFLPHEIGNLPAGVTQSGMIKMNDTIDKIEK